MNLFSTILASYISSASTDMCRVLIPGLFKVCSSPADAFFLERLEVSGRVFKRGAPILVHSEGFVSEDIVAGATGFVTVSRNGGPEQQLIGDFCEVISKVGIDCPLVKGRFQRHKVVNFPTKYPSGQYHIVAEGVTKNGRPISRWELDFNVID